MSEREIISLYLGQAGVRFAPTNWELHGKEHAICSSGAMDSPHPQEEGRMDNVVYRELADGKFAARAVIADLEPHAINSIREDMGIVPPEGFLTGAKDGKKNFARGRYLMGPYATDLVIEGMRKQAERSDNLQGVLLFHSIGGGTGSGFTPLVLEGLADEYQKTTKLQFAMYSTSTFRENQEEPYNAVLHTHAAAGLADCIFMMDNSIIADRCHMLRRATPGYQPTFLDLNLVIAEVVSFVTASLRHTFGTRLHKTMDEIVSNLVLHPAMRYPLVSLAPFFRESKCEDPGQKLLSVNRLTTRCLRATGALQNVESRFGKTIASCWLYKGKIESTKVDAYIERLKLNKDFEWVNWCDTAGVKFGIHPKRNQQVDGSVIPNVPRSLCILQNSSANVAPWCGLGIEFDKLYEKKTSVYRYIEEGMEEGEFDCAKDTLDRIIEDFASVNF